jgi:hypothetical protein
MPSQQRVRRDEERAAALAREQPAGGGEERAIRRSKRGPSDLAPKNRQLMTQNHDLKLFELPRAAAERSELEQTSQGEVEQRSQQTQPPVSRTKSARLYGCVSR